MRCRSLSDSRAIIAGAKGATRAVIVGASFIGLEAAASLRTRGLEVHEGSVTALPFPDASFDVTCSFKVLAHVPDIGRALAEMAKASLQAAE